MSGGWINSIIDDVRLGPISSGHGPPVLFTNAEIRKMLRLAKVGKDDVVVDLGCGWAQNLIIAATEFSVRKCIGIERLRSRYLKAKQRVEKRSLSSQITIIEGQFEDFIDGNSEGAKIGDASVVIYLLETDRDIIDQLSGKVQKGSRLVYYFRALFPEIKPDAIDHPFYVSNFPFKRPLSEIDWLRSVIQKNTTNSETEEELWEELYHEYHIIELGRRDVSKYKTRLKAFLRSVK